MGAGLEGEGEDGEEEHPGEGGEGGQALGLVAWHGGWLACGVISTQNKSLEAQVCTSLRNTLEKCAIEGALGAHSCHQLQLDPHANA